MMDPYVYEGTDNKQNTDQQHHEGDDNDVR